MAYQEVIETRGRYRAIIEVDEYPSEPDWDGMAHVYDVRLGDPVSVTTRHVDYSREREASELRDALRRALAHARSYARTDIADEWTFAERYLRTFYGVVSFDRISWDRDDLAAIVTADLADAWGCPPDKQGDAATSALVPWRAYGEGDVWLAVIEQSVKWERTDTHETRDDWEVIDSCGGYYGADDARGEAMDMLASYTADA